MLATFGLSLSLANMFQQPHRDAADSVFDANLSDFAAKVANICALEAGEKISPEEAYDRIKQHWKALKRSKRNLLDDHDCSQA